MQSSTHLLFEVQAASLNIYPSKISDTIGFVFNISFDIIPVLLLLAAIVGIEMLFLQCYIV